MHWQDSDSLSTPTRHGESVTWTPGQNPGRTRPKNPAPRAQRPAPRPVPRATSPAPWNLDPGPEPGPHTPEEPQRSHHVKAESLRTNLHAYISNICLRETEAHHLIVLFDLCCNLIANPDKILPLPLFLCFLLL